MQILLFNISKTALFKNQQTTLISTETCNFCAETLLALTIPSTFQAIYLWFYTLAKTEL